MFHQTAPSLCAQNILDGCRLQTSLPYTGIVRSLMARNPGREVVMHALGIRPAASALRHMSIRRMKQALMKSTFNRTFPDLSFHFEGVPW